MLHFYVLFGSQKYDLIGSARFDLPWQITGIEVVFSKPIASADANSLAGLSVTGFSGLGTDSLTWTISPLTIGAFSTLLAGSGPDAVKDAAGNTLGDGFAQNFNVLYGDTLGHGAVDAADVVAVRNAIGQPYDIFMDINGDGVVDNTDMGLARSRIGAHL